jgi:A/G-specific adenine glycosylase
LTIGTSRIESSAAIRTRFRAALRSWYGAHARALPWRETHDPYAILVSEIMLQQTQTATVISYYRRFLARFPDVASLAQADEQDVLRLWEGLGYYRRARSLHRAAKEVVDRFGRQFPRDVETIRTLPGVGRYTAGAVASFAFDAQAPIVEANTQRLYARLAAIEDDLTKPASQRRLWSIAEALLPREEPGKFNQALMDLGSVICTPKRPRCQECPVAKQCDAYASNAVDRIPAPKRPPNWESVEETLWIVRDDDRVFLRQRGPDERWAGLWDFVRLGASDLQAEAGGPSTPEATLPLAEAVVGQPLDFAGRFAVLKHGVTRFRITLVCLEATVRRQGRGGRRSAKQATAEAGVLWATPEEMASLPLSTTARKIAQMLKSGQAGKLL